MNASVKTIYLVDVSSLFFRAFYAIRPLTSKNGVPVNAVYGFISMIVKLMKDKNPEYVLFCYDRKEPSFRKDLYADYKANRTEMPDDLQVQMPYIKKVAELFGIADLELAGYEADDLIGTVSKEAEKKGYQAIIVSGDKDFSQLVSPHIYIYDTMKEFMYTPEAVKEKHGVYPEFFRDFLAITGDTSDHIPGVAGIGPKGAQKLIEQYQTLENIYQNIDKISPAGIQAKLRQAQEMAFLSQKLVTIATEIPEISQNFDLENYRLNPFKTSELRSFLQELNFKTFERTLLDEGSQSFLKAHSQVTSHHASSNHTNDQSQKMELNLLSQSSGDSEFLTNKVTDQEKIDNINPLDFVSNQKIIPQLTFIEFNEQVHEELQKQNNLFFFAEKSDLFIVFGLNWTQCNFSQLKLSWKNILWRGFDLKSIWHQLGLDRQVVFDLEIESDLMLGLYCLESKDVSDPFKIVQDRFDIKIEKASELIPYLVALNQSLWPELEQKSLKVIYDKIEKPLIPILYNMEKQGITLDVQHLKKQSALLSAELINIEKAVYEMAGEKFNIASPKQLGVILFERMGLDVIKKTKTGYSTDNEVLEKLNHPIAKLLMQYREYSKLKSTYLDTLPELVDQNNRVHTTFNQAQTSTGRLSSTHPNLQNIPIKTEHGREVRKAFIAPHDLILASKTSSEKSDSQISFEDVRHEAVLVSADYSQIELRVLAHISQDEGLQKAFKQDLDIHTATASEVFGVSLDQVTKDQRRIAKAVNFGIAYGQGAYGLAETLGIARGESKAIIDNYFKKFAKIKNYIESTIQEAHQKKYVETLFGRRRYIKELDSSQAMIKKFGERAAINAPIQGTASEIVKLAMIDIQNYLNYAKSEFKLLLQVHDELIFEGPVSQVEKFKSEIKIIMENVVKLTVPLKVNIEHGHSWDDK